MTSILGMKNLIPILLTSALLLSGCQRGNVSPMETSTPSPAASVAPIQQDIVATSTLGDLASERPESVTLVADHTGKADSAFKFSGESASLSSQVDINPEVLAQCTLVTWAKYEGEPENGEVQQVVSHDDGGYDRSIGLDNRAGQWGWSCFAGSQSVAGGFPVKPGQWTFLAAVYDQSAKTLIFYAGDQKVEVADVEMGAGLNTTNVGSNPSYGEYFKGEIEPVKVFDRALTDEEIQTLRQH